MDYSFFFGRFIALSRLDRLTPLTSLACWCCFVVILASPASADTGFKDLRIVQDPDLRLDYMVKYNIFSIAKANLALEFDKKGYVGSLHLRPSGLASLFFNLKGLVNVNGYRSFNGNFLSIKYVLDGKSNRKKYKVLLERKSTKAPLVLKEHYPKLKDKQLRYKISEQDLKKATDVFSSILRPMNSSDPYEGATCKFSSIYTGSYLFRLDLDYIGTKMLKIGGKAKKMVLCEGKLIFMGGHRKSKQQSEQNKHSGGIDKKDSKNSKNKNSKNKANSARDSISFLKVKIWQFPIEEKRIIVPYKIIVTNKKSNSINITAERYSY